MALRRCRECTTAFAVGLPACPHCQSTDHEEDGAMPKITRHGGPTIAGASVVGGAWSSEGDEDVWPEPEQADEEPAVEEGGEESSAGNSSSTSDEKPSSEPKRSVKSSPSRARTTASRSKKAATAKASSAPSTDGGPEDGTSAADGAGE